MAKKILFGILIAILMFVIYMFFQLRDNNQPLSPKITFLSKPPVIDGLLDENLKDILPKREFEYKFNINLFKGSAGSNYRLAYGTEYIYLFTEAEADSFICRNRGYQNGDGFIFTLSITKPGANKTGEYYLLGFSSQNDPDQEWAKKCFGIIMDK